jgi:hypothetical protein
MTNLFLPFCFGSIVLFGVVVGLPDLGWISLVVTGTWWLNSKFNKLGRRIDQLERRLPNPPLDAKPNPHQRC